MISSARIRRLIPLLIVAELLLVGVEQVSADGPIRAQAVVDLNFDEPAGDALDRSLEGRYKNRGKLINGAARVPSPFWGQRGKQALLFEAGKKQYLEIADSSDLDRSDALTVSFFFLSLHELGEGTAHGILGKRSDEKDKESANFGINFSPQKDLFQVYLHHGSGFRYPTYSLKEVLGSRRRVFLTATYERGDAPAPDEDGDRDDIRIRLFANGQQVKPTKATAATLDGNDAWITDVDASRLLNDTPLTLGTTNAGREHASGVLDEFSLFARALNPAEIGELFVEVAGDDAAGLAARERQEKSKPPAPRIVSASLQGLRAGDRTRLSITGTNLTRNPRVILPVSNVKQMVLRASDAAKLAVDLSLPIDTAPGYYPLRVQTEDGLSNALVIAVDRLPQLSAEGSSADNPAPLPSAFSGRLSGGGQARIFFYGQAGQRVAADVDARRIGSRIDPVVEIKNERGTPLTIEWSKVHLRGDARAELVLPEDGVYFVELHDLSYKAPGNSPFRLKIGNIAIVDSLFPPTGARGGDLNLKPIGTGIPEGTLFAARTQTALGRSSQLVSLPSALEPYGPAPPLGISDATEIVETAPAEKGLQRVDARFAGSGVVPIAVSGQVSAAGEQDRYLLQVTPEQKLNLTLLARAVDSPLDGRLQVLKHPEGNLLAASEDRPGTRDPALNYTVPQGVEQIQIAVDDLHGRGGNHFLYRLRLAPTGHPDYRLSLSAGQLALPENGTATLRLDVTRNGYNGPIDLKLLGDSQVTLQPKQIPAGSGNLKMFVTLKRTDGFSTSDFRRLTLVGESVGREPLLRRIAKVTPSGNHPDIDAFNEQIPTAIGGPVDVSASLAAKPTLFFKGVNTDIPVNVSRVGESAERAIVLSLLSTEATRRVDARDAKKGNKPLVRAIKGSIEPDCGCGNLTLAVPLDVSEGEIDFVIRADARRHAWSNVNHDTAYTEPFRVAIRDAVAVELVPESLSLTAGGANTVRGSLKRTEGYAGSVTLALSGLPEGYSASPVTVPGDKDQFELTVSAAKEEKAKELPKITLSVSATGGGAILPNRSITLKVAPKQE